MNDIAYRNTNKEKIDYVVTDPVTMPDDGGNIPITFYYDACKASVDTEFVLYAIGTDRERISTETDENIILVYKLCIIIQNCRYELVFKLCAVLAADDDVACGDTDWFCERMCTCGDEQLITVGQDKVVVIHRDMLLMYDMYIISYLNELCKWVEHVHRDNSLLLHQRL